MTPRWQWMLFVVCLTLLILGALVYIGVTVKSEWSTFVPDLIIGVVGAAVIGLVLMALQQSTDRRRSHAADVNAAYNRLLDALTPLRTLDVATGDATQVSEMRTRMLQLYETVDEADDQATFGKWINAEGQLCLFQALSSLEALRAVSDRSNAEAVLKASAPFHQWVAEFTHNLRFWRTGRLEESVMRTQAELIEVKLREEGVWREDETSWRDDPTDGSQS
ncbi:hypothetical protein [Microbacterium sp. 22296]|uniref:hypothetical protein n=1 Tax=Microbacterium sp. 22296 TaxID=3453903 RepID=UPI003F84F251